MQTTQQHGTTEQPGMMNGVNLAAMNETIGNIKRDPGLAKFKFRNKNEWITCGHNKSLVSTYYGAGQEFGHKSGQIMMEADEPEVLLGGDEAANPGEYLLHSLGSCITTSIAFHAAAKGIKIDKLSSEIEGDIDLQGFLGLSDNVKKGYEEIRVDLHVKTNGSEQDIKDCVQFSPVYNMLMKSVPIKLNIDISK